MLFEIEATTAMTFSLDSTCLFTTVDTHVLASYKLQTDIDKD